MSEQSNNSTTRQAIRKKIAAHDPFQPGFLSRLNRPPQTIAVVCASRIGDFVCATPAFRALKNRLPDARITLIGLSFVRDLVERNSSLDDFEPFPGFPGIAEQFFDARQASAFFERIQRRDFDLAIQMHGSGRYSNIFALMLGATHTAGFVTDGFASRLDAAMPWPESLHARRRSLALVRFLGAESSDDMPEFKLLEADRNAADFLLQGCSRPLIGLHAGSREAGKMWPEDNFTEAAINLRRFFGGTIVIVGGPEEGTAGERMARRIGPPVLNLAGRRPLGEMGAVIARLSVLVTNDSGPAHIAYALGIPTVTLFGETYPAEWGPPARPFHRVVVSRDGRLASIGVGDVIREAVAAAGWQIEETE